MASKVSPGSVMEHVAAPSYYKPFQTEHEITEMVKGLLDIYKDSGKMVDYNATVTHSAMTYEVKTIIEREGSVDQGRIEFVIKDLADNLLKREVYRCQDKSWVLEKTPDAEVRAKEEADATDSGGAAAAAAGAGGPPGGRPLTLRLVPSGGAAAAAAGSPAGATSGPPTTAGKSSSSSSPPAAGSAGGSSTPRPPALPPYGKKA